MHPGAILRLATTTILTLTGRANARKTIMLMTPTEAEVTLPGLVRDIAYGTYGPQGFCGDGCVVDVNTTPLLMRAAKAASTFCVSPFLLTLQCVNFLVTATVCPMRTTKIPKMLGIQVKIARATTAKCPTVGMRMRVRNPA